MKSKPGASSVRSEANYPNTLSFEDSGMSTLLVGSVAILSVRSNFLVPIYDARETRFRFDSTAFETIKSLTLYDGDLPPHSIVSVGYTVTSFPYAQHAGAPKVDVAIVFNVLFVILMGHLPDNAEEDEEQEERQA